ncbi:MAG: hypothetical protein VXX58_00250, partial [Pseudomonadota bacterium]|nr:hypothetical protein [Pseudomonadota bacterium]
WQILINRLVISGQNIKPLMETEPNDLLLFTRVQNETVLSSRYIADLDYCFDRQLVRQLFRENNIAYAELISDRIMLLPVFISGDRANLWKQPNPWKNTLERILPDHNGLVRLSIPSGLVLERSITGQGIIADRETVIAKAAQLDQVSMVLLTTARVTISSAGLELAVTGGLYNRNGQQLAALEETRLPMTKSTDLPSYLNTLGQDMIANIEQVWREVNLVDLNAQNMLRLSVEIISLEEWFALLANLKDLSPVEQLELRLLSADMAVMDVTLNGSSEAMDYALEQIGFRIEPNPDTSVGGFFLIKQN